MYHAVHNIITAACRTNGYPERDVRRVTQCSVEEVGSGPASSFTDCYGTGTDECLTDAHHSRTRNEVYLASLISKRKYEDMTSSRSDEVEPEIEHESSRKLSFFRENKRRKPPEAGNLVLMHVQVKVQDQGDDECQGSKRGSSPRSGSSRVLITPEVCGESDLTAENLMAEESSRSSNNDGSSKLESAAESVPNVTSRKPRSGSSVGVLLSFLDQREGKREVPFSETSAAYQSSLGRNDGHTSSLSRQMEGMNESEGVTKLEPTSFRPVAPGSSGEPQAGVHSTSHPENEKWLQLGVGPFRNTASSSRLDPAVEYRRQSPPFQQGNVERPYGKRKTPSLDFQISEGRESNSFGQTPTMAASVQWQTQRGSMPHKVEPTIDSPATLNPHAFVSLPKSSLIRTSVAPEIGPNYNLEKDLCLFGSIVTAPSAQVVLAHTRAPTDELPVITQERHLETMSNLLSASIDTRQQADPPGSVYPVEAENLLLGGVGEPGIFNRALPPFASRSGDEVQFKSPQRATDHSVQFQGESRPTSLRALMQTAEDRRQAAGHSWLSASDSAYKLVPLANNFHGWSSEMNTSTRAGTGSDQVITERYPNQMDPQFQRASDEWGSLFRKVSSSMLFPTQLQLHDGPSRILNLDKSATAVSHEGQGSMGPLKRAIKIQNRPQTQWMRTEALTGTRAEKLEGEDRPGVSSILPERPSVQGRYPDSEQILRPKQAFQRQSWQPAAGQPKLEQGNVTIPRSAAPITSKPGFQVLPSRGTNQAGLWFTLQSEAENQRAELLRPVVVGHISVVLYSRVLALEMSIGSLFAILKRSIYKNEESGLPQINKAYLRVKDGKMPISSVKRYLVTKLGLGSEAEVEITCRGQPVVPNLPLQHVRDEIWYSSLNPSRDQTTTTSGSGDKDDSTSADQRVRPATICNPAVFSKDVVMVLTYRRHARSMPPQHC